MIDSAQDRYIESMPGLAGVAGALVSETRGLVFTSNRGENTVSVLRRRPSGTRSRSASAEAERARLRSRSRHSDCREYRRPLDCGFLFGLGRGRCAPERIAEVKVPGRTRWAIYDAARETFFVNVAAPARIIAIDAREPTRILKEYEVPAAGPHGLDLDPATGRLLCACDTGVLLAIDAASGDVLADVP